MKATKTTVCLIVLLTFATVGFSGCFSSACDYVALDDEERHSNQGKVLISVDNEKMAIELKTCRRRNDYEPTRK